MRTYRLKLKFTATLVMASLVALAGFSTLVPGQATASSHELFKKLSLEDQAYTWSTYKLATNGQCPVDFNVSQNNITAGKWLDAESPRIGHHVEPDDGEINCDNERNWFTTLLKNAGISDVNGAANTVFEKRGDNYYPRPNASRLLDGLLSDKLFGGSGPATAPTHVQYAILMANFTSPGACGAKSPPSGSSGEATIKVYDPATKTVVDRPYNFEKEDDMISLGPGLSGGASDGKMMCSNIASVLADSRYAESVKTAITSGQVSGVASASTTTPGEDPNLQCGTMWNPLNWYICPMVKGINGLVNTLDNAINALLSVDSKEIFDRSTETGRGYYAAWEAFRGIALGILVVAAITMIISQALGFQFLDAYTIKKIFPRLVISIIGIALSWELMRFFVDFTNDLGFGIRQIIYYPFRSLDSDLALGGGATVAVTLLTGAALTSLGIIGLLSFGATALLAVAIAFLVLIIRQLVIVVLILFAPIAIACYILPNTNGVWKLWYESFTKVLLMFPIIVAFLAVGRVFAMTATANNAGEITALSQLLGFAAYFLPYFLIPLTFRFAGGAMRVIGGFTNDKGRGGFDRLRKYRQGKTAQNMHDVWNGTRIKSDNKLGNAFNATTGTLGAIPKTRFNATKPSTYLSSIRGTQSALTNAEREKFKKENLQYQAFNGNDDFLYAAEKLANEGEESAMHYLTKTKGYDENTSKMVMANMRTSLASTSKDTFLEAIATDLPGTGTAFQGGPAEMHDFINRVAGSDRAKAGRLLAQMRSGASQARRFDLSGSGFGDQITAVQKQYEEYNRIDNDASLSAPQKEAAKRQVRENVNEDIMQKALDGQGGAYIAGARTKALVNLAPVMTKRLDEAVRTNDQIGVARELAVLAGRYDAMAQVAPENARMLADHVLSKSLVSANGKSNLMYKTEDGKEQVMTVKQMIESYRTNDDFQNMRREYGSSSLRGAFSAEQAAQLEQVAKAQGHDKPPGVL